ncbi:MAG TPA: TIGR03089 family protein, partial [Marmoricola sp.]|nr:TIGR03089 family protein [Marmoricola sp.]
MRFSDALTARLKQSPGKPLITYYNETTGERSELSTTTYANWVAKTANVLCDELDIMPGDRVGVTLGVHWLTPVFMGAAWLCGAQVVSKQVEPELVVGGPELAEQPHALAC